MGPGTDDIPNMDKLNEAESFLIENNEWVCLNTPEGRNFKVRCPMVIHRIKE